MNKNVPDIFAGKFFLRRNCLFKTLLFLCFLFFSLSNTPFLFSATTQGGVTTYQIGVLANRGKEAATKKWIPTAKLLESKIPNTRFKLVPLSYGEMDQAVKDKQVDFIIPNASYYAKYEVLYGAQAVVTFVNKMNEKPTTKNGGIIFTKADRQDIQTLHDLKGKRIVSSSQRSFAGWITALREIRKAELDEKKDFTSLRFYETHDESVQAVAQGEADAGVIRTGILESLVEKGKIKKGEFRVLNNYRNAENNFDSSTIFYPEWPFTRLKHTSIKVAERIASVLLSMSSRDPAAITGGYEGWTVPLNYEPVHECLKELRWDPYQNYGKVTLKSVFENYGPWVFTILFLLGVTTASALVMVALNQKLNYSRNQLKKQSEELLKSNQELEERTFLLEKQRQEIDRQNLILKNTAINLQRATQDLQLSSKYKSEFLANMSHELRTPLNSLLILSKLLMENKEGNLNSKQTEFAQTIYQSGSHLLRLINDILDLAKVEAGKMELHIEDVSIQDICSQIEKIFSHVAQEKNLELKIIKEENSPHTIRSDSQRILQVLLNLISNAFKFTEEGGITIRAFKPALEECTCIKDPSVVFEVKDTGIGIPEEKQELIFQAFQQADGGTGRKYGGTGLGLSISREFARLLGGGIRLKSQAGMGSIFTLCLPSACPENKAEKKDSLPAASSQCPLNCWEYMKCGREEGGVNAQEWGVCPAYPDHGKDCAKIVGTFCGGKIQGNYAQKIKTCRDCEFFQNENYCHDETVSSETLDDRGRAKPGQKSLLIIEDDPKFAEILLSLAREKEFLCLIAKKGEEGFQMAEHYLPAAITLDLKLPDIGGVSILEKLKNSPRTRDIPIYVITGIEKDKRVSKLEMLGYALKPVTLEQLTDILEKFQSANSSHLKKLLFADHDPVELQNTGNLLRNRFNISLTTSSSARQILDLLQKEKFDCLVTDLKFPDATSVEFLEKIQPIAAAKRLSVIIHVEEDVSFEEKNILRKFRQRILCKKSESKKLLIEKIEEFLYFPSYIQSKASGEDIPDEVLRGKKILIVDDDMRNAYALTAAFDEKGIESVLAVDGAKALEQLHHHSDVDLVLMDIMMPVMDGYEAIYLIRQQEKFKNLPIIALTSKTLHDERERCMKAGADEYLAKPVETDKLLSLIKVFLAAGHIALQMTL